MYRVVISKWNKYSKSEHCSYCKNSLTLIIDHVLYNHIQWFDNIKSVQYNISHQPKRQIDSDSLVISFIISDSFIIFWNHNSNTFNSYSLVRKFTLKPYSNRKTGKLCIYLLFLAKKIRDGFTCGGGRGVRKGVRGWGWGWEGVVGWCQWRAPSLFFYSHFEELQTVLFEVELIINNGP